jgi:hypothetical protein
MVELHGGSFELQSAVGVGTTATVRFPSERLIMVRAPGRDGPTQSTVTGGRAKAS